MKKRILDRVEKGIDAAGKGIDNVGGGITSVMKKEDQLLPEFLPPKGSRKQMEIHDNELDVWESAAKDLGPMDDAEDDNEEVRLKGFISRELEFSYGTNQISAINPICESLLL